MPISARSKVRKRMRRLTYMTEHSPNCAKPYAIHLVRPGAATLDRLPHTQTRDIMGYGKTFEAAARQAMALQRRAKQGFKKSLQPT